MVPAKGMKNGYLWLAGRLELLLVGFGFAGASLSESELRSLLESAEIDKKINRLKPFKSKHLNITVMKLN